MIFCPVSGDRNRTCMISGPPHKAAQRALHGLIAKIKVFYCIFLGEIKKFTIHLLTIILIRIIIKSELVFKENAMEQNKEYVRRIITVVNILDGLYAVGSKWSGVKENTLYLLYALDDGEMHTQKNLCDEWLIPRTTLNTVIKECEAAGYITLKKIPGYKRDLQICLTESGKEFTSQLLAPIHAAEERALIKTLQNCSPEFITDLERFCKNLKTEFEQTEDALCRNK